jgi:pimeloyl-ACP methyl ester carboxylesterase
MGGMTMMALAEARPELLGRVVGACFLSTSAGGLREVSLGVPRPMAGLLHAYGPRAVAALTRAPGYVDRRRQNGSDLDLLVTRLYSYASPVPAAVVDFTAEVLASTPIETVAAFMPEFARHDRLTTLAAYADCEALVLVGDRDLLTPPEHSEAILRWLPHAEHLVVPQAGHMLLMERPGVVNEAIRDLLARALRLHEARTGAGRRGG